MDRFKSAFRIFICACALAAVIPMTGYASIEVDEEEVVFRLDKPGAVKVFIVGDFNNWNPTMDSMVKRDGVWEIRLYLVPGRYRYMFVVDGENIPDPENSNRDADGNPFFIFIEEDGVYDIVYEVSAAGARKVDERYAPDGALSAVAVSDYGLFTASAGVEGEIDGKLRGNMLVGFEYETIAENPVSAYLIRAKGEWDSEKFRLGAFHRSGRIGFDDPLALFTDVGPYAYPLDLFCRGAEVAAVWKGRAEGRVFFANRMDGYSSGLEKGPFAIFPQSYDGNPEDKDMIGVSLKGIMGPVLLQYMYRHDRGPGEQHWYLNEEFITDGYGIRTSHGFLLELEKDDYPVLRAEYITGSTRFYAGSIWHGPVVSPDATLSDHDVDWTDGYRALADLSWSRGSFSCLLGWHRTTIEHNPVLLYPLYWRSAIMDVFQARAGYETKRVDIDLVLELDEFGDPGGYGRTFWLQRSNFWLDGDMMRTELLQFLDSKRVWRASLHVEESGIEDIPGPFRLEGYLSAKANWDGAQKRSMFEVIGGKGIRVSSVISFHTDIRFVTYNDDRWYGENSFFDLWAGLRGSLGGSGWAALGIGVAPHRFDRWYFDFTGDGREEYLLNRGLFRLVRQRGDDYQLLNLQWAEETLAEEWRLSFEAGFTF